MNILLITLDQLRADMVGHPMVETPSLDRLAASGVHFARHFSQSAPCSPGRASLYTGMYQSNHRVVANGTPLDARFDNVAWLARRAGLTPTLFGYTDQGLDPRMAEAEDDPRLDFYAGILPGFDLGLYLPEDQGPWLEWLEDLGHGTFSDYIEALAREPERPAEHSHSAFLSNGFIAWLDQQDAEWFAHVSFLRPHPPYAAAGTYSSLYDPADCGDGIAPAADRHGLHEIALTIDASAAPSTEAGRREMRSQYFGMVTEVDHQLGRILDRLEELDQLADTMIILTADHGEQLCDHGLKEKLGFFPESYAIPCIISDPRLPDGHGTRVEAFTENVDLFATIAVALGLEIPAQGDGMPLQPFFAGDDLQPSQWRSEAHWEWDWRAMVMGSLAPGWPTDRRLEQMNLAVIHDTDGAYVHFADGDWLLFDLVADPTWRTTTSDPVRAASYAQRMLTWRQEHLDRNLADMLLTPERLGRWPS